MERTNTKYNDLKPFRFWCQKVLPLVYDDSLSYYELLDKVIDYLNKTMEDVTVLNDDTEALYTAYNQLQSYVNNYFDNLDVQDEINAKLDQMAIDGTLSSLINPQIPGAVSAWLAANVNPVGSAVIVDSTLTIAGAAADAQATGNALNGKEDILTFDNAPTAGSGNPVRSFGIKTYVDGSVANVVGEIADLRQDTEDEIDDLRGDVEDEITDLKGELNNIESVLEKDLYTAEEIDGALFYENYAINEKGKLQAVSGYSVYKYYLADYIGRTIRVNANSNAPYKCCFASKVGITIGFISFADGLCTVPPNTSSVYITTQDASNDSVFLLSKQKVKETECEFIFTKNLFDKSTAIIGKYVNQINGNINTNANFFASDFIGVESGEQYVFSCSRLAGSRYATYDEMKVFIDGGLITTTDPITMPTNAKYIRISSYNTELNSTQFEKGSSATPYTEYGLKIDEKLLPNYDNNQKSVIGLGFAKASGNLTDGDNLTLFKNNIKKNNVYSFLAKITSFSSIVIGHGTTEYESSYLTITSTNADYTTMSPSSVTTQHTHGLTIAGFIYVVIEVLIGEANVTITSSSGTFNFTTEWNGCSNASPYVKCVSGTLTDCEFTLSSNDLTKPIWYFGDSYVNFRTNNRWTYYMKEKGWLENFLLNGFGGEGSANAYSALQAMMSYGKPEAIVWGMGMNDGSDSSNAPSSTWKTYIDNFIQMCTRNEITPILCTIPTVPSISHEQKNQYVRESGHRYIDFAKAVGAQSDGTWYSDMLSSDNVHPNTLGAIALYERAITDVPELTYSN